MHGCSLERYFGGTGKNVAGGKLVIREDHGSQYTSDHYVYQTDFWDLQRSFAFVRQPETDGVSERFNRTVKEQVSHGRIYKNVEEVRAAVAAFVRLYNEEWLVEKNGHLSPRDHRRQYEEARRLKPTG